MHIAVLSAPITLLLCDVQTFSQAIIMPSNAVLWISILAVALGAQSFLLCMCHYEVK